MLSRTVIAPSMRSAPRFGPLRFLSVGKSKSRRTPGQHQHLRLALVWMLALSLLPFSSLMPSPALAQTNPIQEEEVVYIDAQGFIRVWDPVVPAGSAAVEWVSPEPGYVDVALGDVNNDGDQEIIGIYWNGITGKIVVYDPVLNSRALQADREINGIPSLKLYELVVPGEPIMVGAGELDLGVNGDEIAFGYEVGFSTTIQVLKGTSVNHDGRTWSVHISTTFPFTWNSMTIGNSDGLATDEIVLTDTGNGTSDDKSKLHIYRVDTDSLVAQSPIYKKSSTNNKWRGTAIGEMKKGGAPETVAYRSVAGAGTLTVFLFQYEPNSAGDPDKSFNEAEGDAIEMLRRPHWAFMADINGPVNNVQDFEAFFIREVREDESGDKDRLLVENRGDDSIDKERNSLALDIASNWRRGEGANIDGSADGREEVVLMATSKIRYYRYQASGDEHLKLVAELPVPQNTNEKSLRAGDLDAIGFTSGIELTVESSAVEIQSGNGQTIVSVTIDASAENVPVNVTIDTSSPYVLTANAGGANVTPVTYFVTIDASNLLPDTYGIPVTVTSTEPDVNNSPLSSAISVDVVPATVTVSPNAASAIQFPCTGDAVDREVVLSVRGSTGINYAAVVVTQPEIQEIENLLTGANRSGMVNAAGTMQLSDEYGNMTNLQSLGTAEISSTGIITWPSPSWISAVSMKGTIDKTGTSTIPGPSDILTVTIKGTELPTNTTSATASLILVTDQRTGTSPDNLVFVPVTYLCATAEVSLPLIFPARAVVAR